MTTGFKRVNGRLSMYKDPLAVLDYQIDWTATLQEADGIASAVWIVDEGLTVGDEDSDAATATIWLGGGEVGNIYRVICHITTTQARQDARAFYVHIKVQ